MSRRGEARSIEVTCTVEVEGTADRLHAEVDLGGLPVGPGDEVMVHDAPTGPGPSGHLLCHRRATVVRAGPIQRLRAHLAGYLLLTELYEIGFSVGRTR